MTTAVTNPVALERRLLLRARFLALAFAVAFLLSLTLAFFPFDNLIDRFGAPLGGDFPMFYVAGQTVLDGQPAQLYDDHSQQQRLHALLPDLAADYVLPYRYPPLIAWLFAPVALLPYPIAFFVFAALMLGCWWSAAWLLARHCGNANSQLAIAAGWLMVAWPIGWEAIIGGQASPIALMIVAGVWCCLVTDRQVLAGAVLALAMYKPNVLAFLVLGCLLARPRMLWGAVGMWGALAVFTVMLVGVQGMSDYIQYGARLATQPWADETPFRKVQSIGSVLAPMAQGYERPVLILIGLCLTVWIAMNWRRHSDNNSAARSVIALLFVNYLCNPYVPIYDLLPLIASIGIATAAVDASRISTALGDRRIQATLLLLFVGPHLSQAFAPSIGFQAFPILFTAAFIYWAVTIWQRRLPVAVSAAQGG